MTRKSFGCVGLMATLLARAAAAHIIPVDPSTCGLTIALSAPDAGMTAVVDPPTTDLIRVVYSANGNPNESHVQVCAADAADPSGRCGVAASRAFTIGAVAGTITLGQIFDLQLLSSGDLRGGVPITIATSGGGAVGTFELGTGFEPVGATLLLGRPIDASGAFTLVGGGRLATLPAPLDGDLALSLSCTLAPAPDLDQFALAPRVAKVTGASTRKQTKLTIVIETSAAFPANFAGTPLYLRAGPAEAPIVSVDLAAGLGASRRNRFTGTLDPGTVTVAPLRRKTGLAYRVQVKGLPGLSGTASSGAGELAIETGDLFARQPITLRANRAGTRLALRMP